MRRGIFSNSSSNYVDRAVKEVWAEPASLEARCRCLHRPIESAQYTSIAFGQHLQEAGLLASMGSRGDAYDNALCESFFASLECELLDRSSFLNRSAARLGVFDYIECWYNPHRRHSALAMLSPLEFEGQWRQGQLRKQQVRWPVPPRRLTRR
jgi:transposase InsO family protein